MKYRRVFNSGRSYFFTVVTAKRQPLFNNDRVVNLFSDALRNVMAIHPFTQDAFVIMPDHIHCVWSLPEGDIDYSIRWKLIKSWFKKQVRSLDISQECLEPYHWEHCLEDDRDYQSHLEYIHYNPVKHGLSKTALAWPHSSFKQYVALGVYQHNWGSGRLVLPDTVGSE